MRVHQLNVGICYDTGEGTAEDVDKAFASTVLAVKQNHSGAQYQLGNMFAFGRGTERNLKKAIKCAAICNPQSAIPKRPPNAAVKPLPHPFRAVLHVFHVRVSVAAHSPALRRAHIPGTRRRARRVGGRWIGEDNGWVVWCGGGVVGALAPAHWRPTPVPPSRRL